MIGNKAIWHTDSVLEKTSFHFRGWKIRFVEEIPEDTQVTRRGNKIHVTMALLARPWGDTLPLFSFPEPCSHNCGCEQQMRNNRGLGYSGTATHISVTGIKTTWQRLLKWLLSGGFFLSSNTFIHKWDKPEAEWVDSLDAAASWFYLSVRCCKKIREWWVEGNVEAWQLRSKWADGRTRSTKKSLGEVTYCWK